MISGVHSWSLRWLEMPIKKGMDYRTRNLEGNTPQLVLGNCKVQEDSLDNYSDYSYIYLFGCQKRLEITVKALGMAFLDLLGMLAPLSSMGILIFSFSCMAPLRLLFSRFINPFSQVLLVWNHIWTILLMQFLPLNAL